MKNWSVTTKYQNKQNINNPKSGKGREKDAIRLRWIIYGCILFVGIIFVCWMVYYVVDEGKKCNKFKYE
ncbi:MAG: hypothetical protein J6L69_07620 [Lachnospiraceae bacterium]|nr:hypothetical protein [Lachnospiraceae bacterium]